MASEFKLSVCPHDTAKNLLGWFTLNTYLQRKLGTEFHFWRSAKSLDALNGEATNLRAGMTLIIP